MSEYHKINSIYERDQAGKILPGRYATPEIKYLADCPWIFTEKVDGTNIRITREGNIVRFDGRTDDALLPAKLVRHLQDIFPAELLTKVIATEDFTLYGEGYGAGIQKGAGKYDASGAPHFVLFDVLIETWWLSRENVADIAQKLDIECVPVIGEGTLADAEKMVTFGLESQWGNFYAEGIVARPKVEMFSRAGDRIVTKIKHKDFYTEDFDERAKHVKES